MGPLAGTLRKITKEKQNNNGVLDPAGSPAGRRAGSSLEIGWRPPRGVFWGVSRCAPGVYGACPFPLLLPLFPPSGERPACLPAAPGPA